MAYSASTVITIARKEKGYLEKKTNSNLYSKTGNAGSNNYTKYAEELYKAGYYNGNKNGYAWCDVFADWPFFKAYGKEIGQWLQCQTGDLGAGCKYSAQYYKKAGRFYKTPKFGDQIFFKNKLGQVCHTGLVIGVTDTHVLTIEGNTSSSSGVVANGGCVEEKSYPLKYSRIYGYGRPRYDEEPSADKNVVPSKPTTKDVCEVVLPILKKGAESGYVKTLQILLNKYNSAKLEEDGIFGSATLNAVKNYQKSRKLTVDGEVGSETWTSLIEQ